MDIHWLDVGRKMNHSKESWNHMESIYIYEYIRNRILNGQ